MGKIGDLWVRLGLKKSDFEKGMDSAKKKGVDTFKGIAGAAGVAMGAIEVFNRAVTSNETNNDKWENTVRSMNNAVNEFFSALTSGDFSGFQNGLEGIARKARETAEALRQIEDAQTVYGLFSSENRAIFNENMVTLRNKNASHEEINAAKKAIEDVIAKQTEESGVLADKALQAVQNIIAQRGNINAADISEADVKDMLSIVLDRQGGLKDEALAQRYKEYEEAYKNLRARYSEIDYITGRSMFVGGNDYRQELASLNNEYADANLYNAIWNKVNGNELKQLVSFLQSAYAARSEIASMQRTYQRAGQSTDTVFKKIEDNLLSEGSIAYLQAQLKDAQDTVVNTTDETARIAAQKTIDELKGQISGMTMWAETQAALQSGNLMRFIFGDNYGIDEGAFDKIQYVDDKIDVKDEKIEVPEIPDQSDTIQETTDALGVLGGAISNITGLVDSGAAAWADYFGNIIQTVGQAIPLIDALTNSQNRAAAAEGKKAAMGAGSAVSNIPIVGPIMAVAAIASVVAALANIPKFAQGGIVGGSSYYGDRILARLNSGEMVLNQDQQRKLLSGMEYSSQEVHVSGDFRISGRELRLVLDRYDKYKEQ